MSEVVLHVPVRSPADETRFAEAMDAFTRWRSETSEPSVAVGEAPMLMVRTQWADAAKSKLITFSHRREAAMFLRLWRHARIGAAPSRANILRARAIAAPPAAH